MPARRNGPVRSNVRRQKMPAQLCHRSSVPRPLAIALLIAAAAVLSEASAFSLQCKVGAARCIRSQGTEIPAKQAIEILVLCGDFTANDIGRIAMRLSYVEIHERTGGKVTPLARAWHAYGELIDSPLNFERKARAEEARYPEIKQTCRQLEHDFNDDSKWTK